MSLRCNWYSVRRTHKHSDQTVYCLLNKLILLKSIINVSNKCVISHIWSAKGAHGWMCDTLPPGSNINRYGISHEFPCSRVWNAKSPGLLHTDTCTREHCIIIILTGRPIQPRHCVISIYGAAQWHSIIEIIRMKISYSTNFVFMHLGTGVLQCKLCVLYLLQFAACARCSCCRWKMGKMRSTEKSIHRSGFGAGKLSALCMTFTSIATARGVWLKIVARANRMGKCYGDTGKGDKPNDETHIEPLHHKQYAAASRESNGLVRNDVCVNVRIC